MAEYSQVELSSQWRLRNCGSGGRHIRRWLNRVSLTSSLTNSTVRGTKGVIASFFDESLVNLTGVAIFQRAAGSWYQ